MVVYEWADSRYLGKVIDPNADYYVSCSNNVSRHSIHTSQKTYVCTSSVVAAGHCTQAQLGQFIIDLPENKSMNNTSFWSARVVLPDNSVSSNRTARDISNNPAGKATSPHEYQLPRRRGQPLAPDGTLSRRQSLNSSPQSPYRYIEPIHYIVRKTGYYCVGMSTVMFIYCKVQYP